MEAAGDGATVDIPVDNGSDISAGVLTGQMVKNMETKDATLVVQTGSATYMLPAKEIDIDEVAGQFGEDIDLSDIEVEVTISEPDDSTVQVTENAAEDGGFTLIVQPVEVMAMIARAMKITGLEVSLSDSDIGELLADYLDGASVSDYAVGGIAACLQTGIVSGRSDTMISSKDYVTRAEVAVMVQRLLQKSELI